MGLKEALEKAGLRLSKPSLPPLDPATASEHVVKLETFDDDRHIAFGMAYVAEVLDKASGEMVQVVDHSGEVVDDPAVLEEAGYVFALQYREGDEGHTEAVKAYLIESIVFTPDKLEKWATDPEGAVDQEKLSVLKDTFGTSFWTGWYIPDDALWKKVRDGELGALSIGGLAQKEALADA